MHIFGILCKYLLHRPGFEIMGNPSNIYTDLENKYYHKLACQSIIVV